MFFIQQVYSFLRFEMKRKAFVEDVMFFDSQLQRSHSRHLCIVLLMEPLLVNDVLPV